MILRRYVLTRFVQSYLLAVCALVGIFLVVDFFEQIDEFVARDSPISDIVFYFLYKIPFILFFMGPQAVLLGTVIALASLARHNEFTAMRACGIGVTGITLPLIGASVIIALLVLASNEYLAPITNKKMNYIFFKKVRGKPTYGQVQKENIWYKSKNGAIWNITHYDPELSIMEGVSIFIVDIHQNLRQRIDASKVQWSGTRWKFLDGYVRTFRQNGLENTEYFQIRHFPVPETAADFGKIRKRPEEMSLSEMYRSIQKQSAAGKDTTQKWVELNHKFSYPFIAVVLALMAIPLSLRSSRHGGVLFCVSVNLGIGFLFSFFYAVSISLGRGETFDPIMAAWGPIALFTCIGLYLILTLDSDRLLPF
ncbi:MAG: LPS export ABC transporter permease LptG [Nitrospinaceae bacterium]|nr:LPS export ABC transporter permease LptG [Nitrospinaceae bacterium]NIR56294.1 LPS export ABC transporter permease LptG [Nitrospinaceae bacterium]NIS86751.1 LPS export ABC transporter permease LptG [Nitrospinaceae bacterium]NIT83586.1 LPS export ABC transporter permease LptG [Nitrospinaceae bacterium]NIU45788.1 LPS export ABC transporter permease LptG [Nitrospinaceae bacterium]